MLLKKFKGVCVFKKRKDFEDGPGGWIVNFVVEGDKLVKAWLPESVEGADELHESDVEGYREDLSVLVECEKKLWDSTEKLTVIDIER